MSKLQQHAIPLLSILGADAVFNIAVSSEMLLDGCILKYIDPYLGWWGNTLGDLCVQFLYQNDCLCLTKLPPTMPDCVFGDFVGILFWLGCDMWG